MYTIFTVTIYQLTKRRMVMSKRLTAAVLSLTIMFSAVAPVAYALDETESVQEIRIEEQADMAVVSEEIPAEKETEKTVEEEETQTENTTSDVQLAAEDGQTITEATASVTENVAIDSDLPDNDEIFGAYVEQQFYGNAMAVFGTEARERLTETEKAIYDVLKARIVKVAAEGGQTDRIGISVEDCFADNPTITAQQLGLEKFEVVDGAVNSVHANLVWEAFKNHYAKDFNTQNILTALLHDCPYELYWFDKTKEAGMAISASMSFGGTTEGLFNAHVAKMYFAFKVEADYQAGNNVTVKGDVASVKTAVENANSIAEKYADRSDYEKMLGFKSEICNLVEYNHEAAANSNMSYGNPWQMIYVFDNDPSTNVVCEGYAKAFQYLCDMTEVECYTTKGTMYGGTGAGAHMWNIVPVGNSSFIVDITNSDAGTIGHGGQLFLGGTANGSVENGYVFTIGNTDIIYTYDEDEIAMWGSELLTLAAADFNPVSEEIENGTYGENITWTVSDTDHDGKGDRIVIEGIGELADIDEAAPWEAYKTDITEAVIGDGITYIGFNMFGSYTSLKSVELPQSVAEIGAYAFNKTAIEEITIPDGIREIKANTFSSCDKLRKIVLPQTVTAIGTQAFANCTSVEEIKIPQNVQTVDAEAFWGCTALKSLVYGGSAQNWFDNFRDIVLSDKVNITFEGEKTVYALNEESTGYALIYWEDAAGKVVVAESFRNLPVTEIGEAVFAFNDNITKVIIPENVTTIDKYAFYSCRNIEIIVMPSTLQFIGEDAMAGCSNLKTIVFNGDAQDWYDRYLDILIPADIWVDFVGDSIAFAKLYDDRHEELDEYVLLAWSEASGDIVVPAVFRGLPVTEIGTHVFYGNKNITSVEIEEGIEAIQSSAFEGCENLTTVKLPESVWGIDTNAFAGCNNLKYVYYPSSYNWNHNAVILYEGNEKLADAQFICTTDWGYEIRNYYNGETEEKVAYITGKTNISDELIVPSEIDGLKVMGFAYKGYDSDLERSIGTFENNKIIKTVIIPGTVEQIPLYTFKDCTNLEKIVISEGVEAIREYAFAGCTSVKEITVPSTISWWYNNAFTGIPKTAVIKVAEDSGMDYIFKEMDFQNIIVNVILKGISVKDITIVIGNEYADLPAVSKIPEESTDTIDIVWNVENTDIAEIVEVNGAQKILAKELGATTITATDRNSGFSATANIKVVLPKTEKLTAVWDAETDKAGLEAGESRTMTISGNTVGALSAEYFDFKSSNEKAVTVDENGVITVVFTGSGTASASATITATVKGDTTKKATLSVKAIPKQTAGIEIIAEYDNAAIKTVTNDEGVQTIIIPRSLVKDGTLPISLKAAAKDAQGNEVITNVKWTSDAANIAKVAAVKGTTDSAAVTVGKNVDGLAVITATANDLKKATGTIEIDVRDYTPRLEVNTVTLNTFKTSGESMALYTAHDAILRDYNAQMAMLLAEETQVIGVNLSGTGSENFYAVYDSENSKVLFNTADTVKNGTYKLNLNILTAEGETTQPITVKVANKLPKVTIKQAAQFELFYKDSTTDIVITATDPVMTKEDAAIASVTMTESDTFAATAYNAETDSITLSYLDRDNPLSTFANGRTADTKVNLVVEFEGYREAHIQKNFAVKAKETKVTLGQSRTGTKYSVLGNNNTPINVINAKTKEVLDLADFTVTAQSASADYVTVTKEGANLTVTPKLNGDGKFEVIKNGKPAVSTSHTAKIDVQHSNWIRPVTISHSISINTAVPTVKLKTAGLKLNSAFDTVAETVLVPSLDNCPQFLWTVTAQPTKTQTAEEFAKLDVKVDGWKVTAAFKDGAPAKGAYKYLLTTFIAGKEVKLTLTVNVAETLPNVTLAATSAKLNSAIKEDTAVKFKVPAGYEVTGATVTNSKGNVLTAEDISVKYINGEIAVKVLKADLAKGNYKYDIVPTVKLAGEEYSTETPLKKAAVLTVNVFNGVPNVTYSAKGKIDLVNRGTGITYTLTKGTNFVYSAADVDTETFALVGTDADKFNISYLGTDAKGQHMIEVTAKADAQLKKGSKYSYNIAVDVNGIEEAVTMQKAVTVSPSQSTVKLVTKGSTTIWQSYKGTAYFNIEAATPVGAEIADVQILDTKATTVPNNALDFEVSQDSDGSWKVSYKVKKASKLKVNKTYKVALEITPEGNGENVKPQVLNVTLKVKR